MGGVINSKTKLYAVIGDPISHSLSPDIHNRIFKELNVDKTYLALKIPPSGLMEALSVLRHNFAGFNITIPHKEAIIPYLDEIDESAKIYGAVNTVKIEDGKLRGYNTDGYGFIKSIDTSGMNIEGKRVLMMGSGGAARVIAFELLNKGCHLTIANRNLDKANKLKMELLESSCNRNIIVTKPTELNKDYFCIVNTTPLGMAPLEKETPILDKSILKGATIVYDLIYNPFKTVLLEDAEEEGCIILNGFSMLFYQAIKAQEIWHNDTLEGKLTEKVYRQVEESFIRTSQIDL